MHKAETIDVAFSLERNTESQSALLERKPIARDNGSYVLRVTQADVSLNSATFRLERIFADEEAVQQFSAYYTEKHGPYWGFAFLDENEDTQWSGNIDGSADTEMPEEQADGTWVWGYTAVMTNLARIPATITVLPLRDDVDSGEFDVAFPEEAIELSFE